MASLEHQKLSSSIKEVHRQLREAVANGEDPDKVWNVHVNKGDILQVFFNLKLFPPIIRQFTLVNIFSKNDLQLYFQIMYDCSSS